MAKLVLHIIKKNFTDIRTKRLINKLYKTYNVGTRRLKKLVDEGHINRENEHRGVGLFY